MTLWEGRLGGTADEVMAFTVSLPFDRRLAADDLTGSRAHVRGLGRAGVLDDGEVAILLAALDRVEEELASGTFAFQPEDEDIHTAVERRVTEIAADVGAKLHTGRSRNDQVATDLRLYARRELIGVAGHVLDLQEVLRRRAVEAGDAYLPGYTHLQRAQPVLLAHHLLAHAWALARDVDRLMHTVVRLDVSPLGAGALAGSSLALDPDAVAAELGFAGRFENSLDAVSDRDFVAEALFDLALLGVHLSRMGEELVLWSTEEFGFVTLDDAYATGSSMLPQKKNPDVAELARGKAGRLIGHLAGILATLKGLPLAYNRDLQEDKEPLFDALDQVSRALLAMTGMLAECAFRHRPHASRGRRRPGGGRRPGRMAGRPRRSLPPGPCHRRLARPRLPPARRPPLRAGPGPPRPRHRGPPPPRARRGRHPPHLTRRSRPRPRGRPDRALRPPYRARPRAGGPRPGRGHLPPQALRRRGFVGVGGRFGGVRAVRAGAGREVRVGRDAADREEAPRVTTVTPGAGPTAPACSSFPGTSTTPIRSSWGHYF